MEEWTIAANKMAKELASTANIVGSEKQIAWALDLVERFVFVTSTNFKSTEQDEAKEFAKWVIDKHPTAKWWIDHRFNGWNQWDIMHDEWEEIKEG